jgi:Dyp-type peroxidase family
MTMVNDVPPKVEYHVPLDQVQGNITPGFRKDYQAFLFIQFPKVAVNEALGAAPTRAGRSATREVRKWLGGLVNDEGRGITTAEAAQASVVKFRAERAERRKRGLKGKDLDEPPPNKDTFVNVAFTARGLGCLLGATPSARESLPTDPPDRLQGFLDGMCNRNGWTGDDLEDIAGFRFRDNVRGDLDSPRGDLGDLGARKRSGPQEEAQVAHAVLIFGADYDEDLRKRVNTEIEHAERAGLTVLQGATIWAETLTGGREHFGFTDSRSQPEPDDLTDGTWAADGEKVVAADEFIRGCRPKAEAERVPASTLNTWDWERYGSYLVVRKLEQDVDKFNKQMNDLGKMLQEELSLRPRAGDPTTAARLVAAKLLGRWPSGATAIEEIVRNGEIPTDPFANAESSSDVRPATAAELRSDPNGAGCPLFSHVRKANPRVESNAVTKEELKTHRIIRRGVPYVDRDPVTREEKGRGLVFLAYQARIQDGYEHIQREWLNSGYFGRPEAFKNGARLPAEPARRGDPPSPGPDILSVVKRRAGNQQLFIRNKPGDQEGSYLELPFERVVVARGGGYFFSPSIDVLHELANG